MIFLSILIAGCGEPEQIGNIVDDEIVYELPSGFPDDFPAMYDNLTGAIQPGWGGGEGEITHTPAVFIHGLAHYAENWNTMANYFLDSGYTPAELWAISYLDLNGGDSTNSNMANFPEIKTFVDAVLEYTGKEKVNLISHSLGVTVSRAWLKSEDDYSKIEHFVGIAGPNHGVNYCAYNLVQPNCIELGHPHSDFLTWLNENDETPEDETVGYLTIYDGTGMDIFFPNNAVMNDSSIFDLRLSPQLDGAENIQFAGLGHIALQTSKDVATEIVRFLNE